ncbi:MAG: tetratricopeptide repeat protein [Deltaproteobacteria bacterium]|nr:tetratricopeptide repeat protein [Deltaproteobacteria bacterium]
MRRLTCLFVLLGLAVIPAVVWGQDKAAQSKALKEQADGLMKSGNRAVAITTYRNAIALDPNNWQAHDALGTAYFKEKMYLDGAMEFTEAIALNPGYHAGYYNVAYAYRKAGKYNEAIKYYEKYTKMKPDDTDAFYGLAESYKAVGEKEKAIENYQTYVQKEQRPSEQKWIDKARASIAELQGGSPAAAPVMMAPVPAAAGYGRPAAAAAQPAYASQPQYAPPAQPVPAAQPSYQQPPPSTLAVTAIFGDPLVAEGDAHYKARSYPNAVTSYRDAIYRNPNNVEAHYKLGLAYAVTNRLDLAVASWKKVVELDPGNAGARDNIAKAEARLRGAAPVAQPVAPPAPAVQPLPQQPSAAAQPAMGFGELFQAAMAANGRNDYQGAVNLAAQVLRMKQDFAPAYVVQGDAFIGLGQMQQAIQAYNNARAFDSGLSAPLHGLAEAYRLLPDKDKAVHYYKLFLKSSGPDKEKWRVDRAAKMLQMLGGSL